MIRNIVLFSGGMDSLITAQSLHVVNALDQLVYCNIGHKYSSVESARALNLAHNIYSNIPMVILNNIDLGLYERSNAHIPLRNMYLIMNAVNYGLLKFPDDELSLWLTVQKDETSIPDRTPYFFSMMTSLMSEHAEKFALVQSPFFEMDKTSMVGYYLQKLNGTKDILVNHSYSCFVGGEIECGDCPACFRKWVALKNNGIDGNFNVNPLLSKTAERYVKELDHYPLSRQSRIKQAMGL